LLNTVRLEIFVEKAFTPFPDQQIPREMWTAGKNSPGCLEKFRWCSPKLKDFLKSELEWKRNLPTPKPNSCVYLENGEKKESKLAFTDCDTVKDFICEARNDLIFLSTLLSCN